MDHRTKVFVSPNPKKYPVPRFSGNIVPHFIFISGSIKGFSIISIFSRLLQILKKKTFRTLKHLLNRRHFENTIKFKKQLYTNILNSIHLKQTESNLKFFKLQFKFIF